MDSQPHPIILLASLAIGLNYLELLIPPTLVKVLAISSLIFLITLGAILILGDRGFVLGLLTGAIIGPLCIIYL